MALERLPIKKGRPYILVALLIAVLVLMSCLVKCEHQEILPGHLQPIKKKSGGDTIDVAIEISPLSFRMSGDSIIGLDYDILTSYSRISGRPIKFHAFARLEDALNGLNTGLYDIIVSSLPSTETLKQNFRLTHEIYLDREVLVQQKNSGRFIANHEDLGEDTIWIAGGSPFAERIANLSEEIGDTIYIKEMEGRTAEHLIMLVARGEIPRAVVNEGLAKKMRDMYYPNLDLSTPISFTQFQSWIVTDNEKKLLDDINTWLTKFRKTQKYLNLLEQYGVAQQDTLPKRRAIELPDSVKSH